MAVTKPVLYSEILDIEVKVGRAPNEEVLGKMIQNINMLGQLAMIGSVNAIALNQSGVTTPVATVFQSCDGSEITDLDSPLSSEPGFPYYAPNMQNRYVRGANASTVLGNETGGANSATDAHSHGGATYGNDDGTINDASSDGAEQPAMDINFKVHSHNISEVTFNLDINPYYQEVQFYLKIN